MRQWTDQQRADAATRARLYRAWARSTGPRSALGKFISSRNSYKHGRFTYEKRLLGWYVRLAALRIKQLKTRLNYQDQKRENELIEKYGLPTPFRPDRMAFYPYFAVHPLHEKRKRVHTPRKKSQAQEMFDFFTSLSDD
ncbi:MAG: hypothetical protein A3J37_07765 [Alphaproteobacteria bacterium RIFCSPHIGHO2_12_FULL_45_9]|nr:MAG: hypothetical protein A3J37_07765 [Alphaproteobacteria bacterium RIFCSPHIGHO2_12_FULL_45_9]